MVDTDVILAKCKYCSGINVKRFGHYKGNQRWYCKDCERKFTEKDTLPRMRYSVDQIAAAVRLYYEGLSLDAIKEEFQHQFNKRVSTSAIYNWIQEFTNEAIKRAMEFKPKIGDVWIADETALTVRGKTKRGTKHEHWFYLLDVIDPKSRFLLATRLSPTRSIADVEVVMKEAAERAGKAPSRILTDKMQGYPDAIKVVFKGGTEHVQTSPFVSTDHTNVLERFHGTLKDRTKVLRGFKTVDSGKQVVDGWLIYYNFFRPHESLKNQSPAQHMKIDMPFVSWAGIVRNTKEREAKPQPQIKAIPRAQLFKIDPELKKAQQRKWARDWYRRQHAPKYKPRRGSPDVGLSGMR